MKRILLVLTVAALFVVGMIAAAIPAGAAPCSNPASNNPHCVTELPSGNQPNPNSNACGNNPNCTREFENPSPNR